MRYDSSLRCHHCMHCHSHPCMRAFWAALSPLSERLFRQSHTGRQFPLQADLLGADYRPCITPLQGSHACMMTNAHAAIDSPLCMHSPQGLLGLRCQPSEKGISCRQKKICQVGNPLLRQPSLSGQATGLAPIPCKEAYMHSDSTTCCNS